MIEIVHHVSASVQKKKREKILYTCEVSPETDRRHLEMARVAPLHMRQRPEGNRRYFVKFIDGQNGQAPSWSGRDTLPRMRQRPEVNRRHF